MGLTTLRVHHHIIKGSRSAHEHMYDYGDLTDMMLQALKKKGMML